MEIRQTDPAVVPPTTSTPGPNRAPRRESAGSDAAAAAPSTIVNLSASGTAASESEGAADTVDGASSQTPSPVKSFTYGVLGLSAPKPEEEEAAEPSNPYFTAGKLLAAAATVGTIISLVA